jgi:glycosyltransferase involved in cell wall biosynthesis
VKRIVVFNAGPLHNQSAGIHVWTKEILKALHDLKLQGQMPDHLEWIIITEKPTDDYPLFQVKTIPVFRYFPGYAAIRLFFLLPIIAIKAQANCFIEPAHFGPFNLPKRINRITVIHDLTPILFPHWHRKFSSLAQRLFFRQILTNTQQIIAVSHSTKSDLERLYPFTSAKIKVIYPGISKKFTSDPEVKREPFLLFVGTIEPRKNLEGVIKFFEEIKEIPKYKHFKLIIAGRKGWKTSEFDRAYRKCKYKTDISLEGYISEDRKIQLYRSCSVFIYLSHYEGFGFPILEALACGAPVITSRNSSLEEIGRDYVHYLEGASQEVFEKSINVTPPKLKDHFNWKTSGLSLTDSITK